MNYTITIDFQAPNYDEAGKVSHEIVNALMDHVTHEIWVHGPEPVTFEGESE